MRGFAKIQPFHTPAAGPWLIMLALLTTGLSSCEQPPKRDPSTVFRYNEAAGITSLDPAFSRNQANIWAVNQIFSGLVQMDANLNVQPAIARSWQIGDSGKTYRFRLREDVYFHPSPCFSNKEERRVVAEDFKYSFERLQDPELAAPGSWVMQQVAGIEAPSDTVLVLRLHQPFAPFLSLLTMQYCAVVPREAVDYFANDFRKNPVGTGPFYFRRWVEDEKLVLRRYQDYWEKDSSGNSLPYLEAVSIRFVPDKQAAFLEFVKGNLDLISGLDPSYKDELLTGDGQLQEKFREDYQLYRQPYLNTEYLAFLVDSSAGVMENSPLLNPKLRRAINHSFDRKLMMRHLRNNVGTPATAGMIPPGLPAFDSAAVPGYHYDPERARELLAEAGFPKGRGLPTITLQTNSSYLDLCEYIQSEARKVGIPIDVEVSPPSTLRQSIATAKVPFFRASWIADYPDAENYLSLFYSENHAPEGPNYSHFSHPQFDKWYEEISSSTDPALRRRRSRQMDSLVMAHAPVVPLYYDQVLRFSPKSVSGLEGNAMNLLDLRRVRKE